MMHYPFAAIRLGSFLTILLLAQATAVPSGSAEEASPELSDLQYDPAKVLGYASCAKCHQAEIEIWKRTPHHTTFQTLHRKPEAQEIAQRLGLTSIKRNQVCTQCHYTEQAQADQQVNAISGVSCESCHGPAQEWLDLHHDYGGPHLRRDQETASHRQLRRQQSIAHGMRNPSNLYLVARSCLNCHTAPHEELVNVGGHPAGSLDFELVSWSQGMVRHNYVRSEGRSNALSSPDRLRIMFVVGIMTDLEFSLRATAKAKHKARYGVTSAKRAQLMTQRLSAVQQLIDNSHVQRALDAVQQVQLKLNNYDQLTAAADEIGAAAFAFAAEADGAALSELDPLLPRPDDYK